MKIYKCRVNIYLKKGQIAVLKQFKQQSGFSVAELIRRAIDFYLESWKKDGKL